jgi:hypothetical protein
MEPTKNMNNTAHHPLSGSSETIDLSRSFDKTYWTHRLHVTEQELTRAVRTVGPGADRVRQYIQDARAPVSRCVGAGEQGPYSP